MCAEAEVCAEPDKLADHKPDTDAESHGQPDGQPLTYGEPQPHHLANAVSNAQPNREPDAQSLAEPVPAAG